MIDLVTSRGGDARRIDQLNYILMHADSQQADNHVWRKVDVTGDVAAIRVPRRETD